MGRCIMSRYKFGNIHQGTYVLDEQTDKKFYTGCLSAKLPLNRVIEAAIIEFMKTAETMGIDYSALVDWLESK
jgi:hypothetical protein